MEKAEIIETEKGPAIAQDNPIKDSKISNAAPVRDSEQRMPAQRRSRSRSRSSSMSSAPEPEQTLQGNRDEVGEYNGLVRKYESTLSHHDARISLKNIYLLNVHNALALVFKDYMRIAVKKNDIAVEDWDCLEQSVTRHGEYKKLSLRANSSRAKKARN